MAITINGSGITSANIADGTITASDISASEVKNLKSGRKNLIINGGFDVWQRGTSFAKTSAGTAFHADRWSTYYNSNTITKVQEVLGETKQNCLKISQSTTANPLEISLKLEDSSIYSGKTLTVSFYAKSSTGFSDLSINAFLRNAAQSNLDTQSVASSVTIGTSFTRYSYTFTMLDKSALTLGESGSHLGITFQRGNGVADFTIAQVQLELGSVATDFEHRSYGEELALCQRYYERSENNAGIVWVRYSNDHRFNTQFTVTKRATPTITTNSDYSVYSTSTAYTLTNASTNNVNTASFRVQFNSSNTNSSGYVNGFDWTADAEL